MIVGSNRRHGLSSYARSSLPHIRYDEVEWDDTSHKGSFHRHPFLQMKVLTSLKGLKVWARLKKSSERTLASFVSESLAPELMNIMKSALSSV